MKKRLLFILCLLSGLLNSQVLQAPIPKKIVDTTILHGDTLIDHYNWMRDKNNASLINYLFEENGYTDQIMSNTFFLQQELQNEIKSRIRENYQSIPVKRDQYYYYSRSEKGKEYSILCRKENSLANSEEVYLDVNELAKGFQFFNLMGLSISPNHKMIAYTIDSKGNEEGTLYIRIIENDSVLEDRIENVGDFVWAEDNKTLFYVKIDPISKKLDKVYKHVLGSKNDELVFEEKREKYSAQLFKSTSKEFIFIATGSFIADEIYYTSALTPKTFKLIAPANEKDKVSYSADHFNGSTFVIITNHNAPNGKVMLANINNLSGNWETLLPHNDSSTVLDYHVFKNYIVVSKISNGLKNIEIIDRITNEIKAINSRDDLSNVEVNHYDKYDEERIWYSVESYVNPSEVILLDLNSGKDSVLRKEEYSWYKQDEFEAKRLWSISEDGTKIPVDVIYKKSTRLNENTPLYLTAYASYGQNTFPQFSIQSIMLAERGFIYAQAHPRGESLFGKKWHDDGKLLKKINTITDFISCTEYLHKTGYSSPQKTAITGRSAGGMLIGAVVTMRPDLYKAAVPGVPYIDVINGQLDTTMPGTIAHFDEIGNPRIKEQYDALKEWDPYQNLKTTHYPDLLVLSGYNDPRVYYWLPTKWVAKLRSIKNDSSILILKTEMESGHFGSSGRYEAIKELAFEYSFIFKSLGIKENYKAIQGKVLDDNGESVPYANVLVLGSQKGTATNFNGEFSIVIRSDEAQEIQISSVGFRNKILKIKDIKEEKLVVTLNSENILLRDVTINSDAKDPAYRIIKNAIEKRKFHLEEVNSYSANIYLKSNVRFDKLPEKLPFFIKAENMPDSTDLGLVYLSESSSKIYVERPNKIKEEMYASVIAGENNGYSFNRTSDVLFNFYENNIELVDMSDRLFLSPIASSALIAYKYRYEGTIFEGSHQIHKIEVRPRITGDPLFHGYIYINDSTWSLYSLDLMLTKDAQIKFYDTLTFKQEYINLKGIWIPRSLKLSSNISIFGLGATFNSVGIFSDYELNRSFEKKFFNNAVFKIEDEANKKDSIYWEDSRPISLTDEEKENYLKQDSLAVIYNSPEYLDSMKKESNKFSLGGFVMGGYTYTIKYDSLFISINSAISTLGFNTVEGWRISPSLILSSLNKNGKRNSYTLSTRYGFENKDWGAKLKTNWELNKKSFESLAVSVGKYIDELNPSIFNTPYSLFGKENYLKLNQKTFSSIYYSRELFNGLYGYLNAEYANRKYLENHSSLSWTKNPRPYSDNFPANDSLLNPFDHEQLTFKVSFKYILNQRYELYPKGKRILNNNKSPELIASYQKGIGLTSESTSYDYVTLGIAQTLKLGLIGNLSYSAIVGKFFNANNIQFWDYKHFLGNQTDFIIPNTNSFETLPLFDYSTNKQYLEIHALHQFNGFIMNKIPLIRKLRWQSLVGLNSVILENKNYHELYFGIENIFKVLRVDFAGAIGSGTSFKPAIRIGLDIGL